MKLSQQSQLQIQSTIEEALARYACGCEQVVTDIHLQPNQTSGELIIFDDDDDVLSSAVIEEWIDYNGPEFYKDTERIFRSILSRAKDAGKFEQLAILQPFTFVLVDEDKETVAEVLLVDEDILLVNDELLKGLDEELDAFLKDLLEN